ncbi:MAG: hypothetical protein SVR08_16180 [Spirochaetota bacterium]|nr:hypothetical protein [Spirochaetota bacterium]
MFKQKRTPILAIILAAIITVIIIQVFENPARPLTIGQSILLYLISLLPSLGILMLFDPAPQEARSSYLKINFYEEK